MSNALPTFARVTLVALAIFLSCVTAQAQWIQSRKIDNVGYFLFSTTPRLERYSLTSNVWLAPISLPATNGSPVCFTVDGESLYVAFGATVKRMGFAGGGATNLATMSGTVSNLFVDGNLLFAVEADKTTSLNKMTGAFVGEGGHDPQLTASSHSRSLRKIFYRTTGFYSPHDIVQIRYHEDGSFEWSEDSLHHGDYPVALRTWLFPDESKVVDDSGTVYSTSNLSYVNQFPTNLTDLDFHGVDVPIGLHGTKLVAYSNTLLPVGTNTLAYTPKNIFVAGTNVVTFTVDTSKTNKIRADMVPLSALKAPTPGQLVNPVGLSYTPDSIFLDTNGVLHLFSRTHQSLFRWNTSNQTYLTTIPLAAVPSYVAYSPGTHRAYVGYPTGSIGNPTGMIRQMNLFSNPVETPFVSTASEMVGLAVAGKYVFVVERTVGQTTHYTYDPSGALVGNSSDIHARSSELTWSEASQKMYFFYDNRSPLDLHWEQISENGSAYAIPAGAIGNTKDSPLHSSEGFIYPIRVSPDGATVVMGSGVMHDATTLARLGSGLSNSVTDIAWTGNELKTIRSIDGVSQLQKWNTLGDFRELPGTPWRLLSLNTNLVAITLVQGRPTFYVMDKDFHFVGPAQPPETPGRLVAKTTSETTVLLTWKDVFGETGYRVQRRALDSNSWETVSAVSSNVVASVVSNLVEGLDYFFRLQAFNPAGDSPHSTEVTAIPYRVVKLIEDDFDPSINGVAWSQISGGVVTNGGSGFRGNKALWFGAETVRRATTVPVNVTRTGGSIDFLIRAGNQDVDGYQMWRNSEEWDRVALEYSTNGTSWLLVQTLDTAYPSLTNWTYFSVPIPPAARSGQTQFRWRQLYHDGEGWDHWALDDVAILGAAPLPPSAPTTIASQAGPSASITLDWAESTGATVYVVERSVGLGEWNVVTSVPYQQNSFVDHLTQSGIAYSYRVKAVNVRGASLYSPTTTAVTWSQREQWVYDNYGDILAVSESAMKQPGSDGVVPLLRFAFNLDAYEPMRRWSVGQTNGFPHIWLDPVTGQLSVEFVRRKAASNPGISYQVEFSDQLTTWNPGATLISVTSIDATWERAFYRDTSGVTSARYCRVAVKFD